MGDVKKQSVAVLYLGLLLYHRTAIYHSFCHILVADALSDNAVLGESCDAGYGNGILVGRHCIGFQEYYVSHSALCVGDSRRMLFCYLCHQGMPCCIVVLSCGNNRIVRQEEMVALGGDMLFAKLVCRCIVRTAILMEKLILRIIEIIINHMNYETFFLFSYICSVCSISLGISYNVGVLHA